MNHLFKYLRKYLVIYTPCMQGAYLVYSMLTILISSTFICKVPPECRGSVGGSREAAWLALLPSPGLCSGGQEVLQAFWYLPEKHSTPSHITRDLVLINLKTSIEGEEGNYSNSTWFWSSIWHQPTYWLSSSLSRSLAFSRSSIMSSRYCNRRL